MKKFIKSKNLLQIVFVSAFALFLPFVTLSKGLSGFIDDITNIIGASFVKLVFALAFAYFFWGVVQYMLYPDDEAKKDKGRQYMVWGIIALTVMFSVYGLIEILSNTFDLGAGSTNNLKMPGLPQ